MLWITSGRLAYLCDKSEFALFCQWAKILIQEYCALFVGRERKDMSVIKYLWETQQEVNNQIFEAIGLPGMKVENLEREDFHRAGRCKECGAILEVMPQFIPGIDETVAVKVCTVCGKEAE
jgi:hypothetical protein